MITGINHVNLAVEDIHRAFAFYRDVLDLKPLCQSDGSAYLLAGDFWVSLDLDREKRRVPSPCNTHLAFTVSAQDFDTLAEKIIATGVVVYKDNTSPGQSLYFQDLDGHKLEIHGGTWQDRVAVKKANPGNWTNVTWYV